ncbi:hypothetical protein FE257_006310 [Aspergillus nanangensis]|uniref:Zn(2)-C6 fungal-type domain-containing protein n=1 Tax=Aspergillus nanangensis TaxID=2582783 RepID=A0AAD4CP62_ASPNN|nr:hypothetical protein FE257_006310 [Aspergillus nanangensis]
MPPRRTHTKSRNGCDQCKKRRVKCDEQGPPCSNCVARELPCTYLNTPVARTLAHSSSPATPLHTPHPSAPSPDSSIITHHHALGPRPATSPDDHHSRRQDLELMHRFSTDTYQSLCNNSLDQHTWQITLPRKALEYDFLMNGILAVAALHTAATTKPPEALSYLDAALEYHNQASTPFRHAIDNITPSNCDAVFAHSVITTVIGIALPRLTAERGEHSSMTENIVVVFELLQGVSKIFRIGRSWFQTNLYTKRKFFPDEPANTLDPDSQDALDRLATLNDAIVAPVDPDQHRILQDAISLLHRCFVRYHHCPDAASVLSWLAVVDKEFVHALMSRLPLAMLVLMHWAVLLGGLDGKLWWARNSGSALISELLVALRPGDATWDAARLWPKRKLALGM